LSEGKIILKKTNLLAGALYIGQRTLAVQRRFDFGRLMLKGIAIGTMTVDHVGAILFPDIAFLRMIGRLAFPIFLYLMLLGIESTRNTKSYFMRLLIFALISQTPYFLAFAIKPYEQLNIFFTLLFGGLSVYLFHKGNLLGLLPVLAAVFLNAEAGLYGIVFVACISLLKKNTALGVLASFLLNSPFLFEWDIQALSLLSLIVIVLHKQGCFRIERETAERAAYFTWMKYAFYVYYPLHLTFLYSVKLYLL